MSDLDAPMALGDHLEELRRRLIVVIIALGLTVVLGMIFQVQLKALVEVPLRHAIALSSDEAIAKLQMTRDPEMPVLRLDSLAESPMNAVKLSFYLALALGFPVLIFQLWAFIAPGLRREERKAGFLFIPAAVLFFYGGVVFGFMLGLPFLFRLLIEWTANENAVLDLRQSYYFSFFGMMTLAFGFVMDIPWLVMVLVKTRVVTPDQVAGSRRFVVLISAVLAAVLTPPDPISQVVMLALMLILFEAGLLGSRMLYRRPEHVTDENVDAVPDLSGYMDGDVASDPPPAPEGDGNNDGRAPWEPVARDEEEKH
ncbi:MAG: twin-arginine translocase subunit TatC [Planctomycetota bacterium]|jgi:sec-independent protein translocase protein TatC|nr:twin-arginine translocase subunit TatC [Planctomycetota bacterium]